MAGLGAEDFARTAKELLAVTDLIGLELPGSEAWRTREHIVVSTRYEWMFVGRCLAPRGLPA